MCRVTRHRPCEDMRQYSHSGRAAAGGKDSGRAGTRVCYAGTGTSGLKDEVARWQRVLGGRLPRVGAPGRRTTRRVDWSAVLAGLPKTFTTKDVAEKAARPIQRAYVYMSRWMKEQKVRKGKYGYQKVSRRR